MFEKTFARIFLALTVAAVTFIALPSFAEKNESRATWKLALQTENPDYPLVYSLGNCTVSPHVSGRGVWVRAVDANWKGGILWQNIVIRDNVFSRTLLSRKEEVFSAVTHNSYQTKSGDMSGSMEAVAVDKMLAYDVFSVKCGEVAKSLPLAVRKAFIGYYKLE